MNIEKLEEVYEYFIHEALPKDKNCVAIDESIIQNLPEEIRYIWKKYGVCSYGDGLWWHTNPRDFDDVVKEWLVNTPYWEPETNRYHVIGRTGYGKLYLWGEKTGQNLEIDTLSGMIFHSESKDKYMNHNDMWIPVTSALYGGDKGFYDETDDNEKPLFDRIHKKLGPLKYNEMYTVAPAPLVGGGITVENTQKEDIFIQLNLLRQFISTPEIIDFENFDK